ncbi:MAG: hypothetical protein KF784_11200 [Fimbriimonadaceae bacterium]|nr:hypothetical protein [Fimbriimonadaceae bacterium]
MDEVVFRYSVGRICLVAFIVTVPLLVVALASSGLSADAILAGCLTAIVADVLLIWAMTCVFPVKVGQNGIAGQTSYGTPIRFSWDEIEAARYINLLGLPYWLVKAKDRNVRMWILTLFANEVSFSRTVIEYAPEGNPFRVALEKKKV